MRRVSLFTKEGRFYKYVHVRGTPRVVMFEGKTYTSYDYPSLSFRECDAEEGFE